MVPGSGFIVGGSAGGGCSGCATVAEEVATCSIFRFCSARFNEWTRESASLRILRLIGAAQFFSELQAQIKSLNRHGNTLGI
jgi:hypothetical protein